MRMYVSRWWVTLFLSSLHQSVSPFPAFTGSPSSLRPRPPKFLPSAAAPTSPRLPSAPSFTGPSPVPSTGPSEQGHCFLEISPSTLVVRFGDPMSANCSLQGIHSPHILGWEVKMEGLEPMMGVGSLVWSVNNLTTWSLESICFAVFEHGGQCFKELNLTVYKPPDSVSISYINHSGPVHEGHQYTLQCRVEDVAPVEKLIVTFHRGNAKLGSAQSRTNPESKPVNETFTVNITSSKEDDGVQYWCEARLDLGPQGPTPPPVVRSQSLTPTVYYGPHSLCPSKLQVREGETLTWQVRGNPHPLVTWLRDGHVVAPPTRLSRNNSGIYTISARGALEQLNCTLEVEVVIAKGTSNTYCRRFLVVLLVQLIYWI